MKLWACVSDPRHVQLLKSKYANNQLLWWQLIKEQKKKEEINNFCNFKDSSIFNLDFSV